MRLIMTPEPASSVPAAVQHGHGRRKVNMTYELPYGIKVVVTEPIYDRSQDPAQVKGTVVSNLAHNLGGPDVSPVGLPRLQGCVETLECFLLALACAGVNIGSQEFLRALHGTVQVLSQRLGDEHRDGPPVQSPPEQSHRQ